MNAPRLQLTCAGLLLGALVAVVDAEDAMWWAPWLKPMRRRISFLAWKGVEQIEEMPFLGRGCSSCLMLAEMHECSVLLVWCCSCTTMVHF